MRSADEFIRRRGFFLPPFAYWTPEQWRAKGGESAEIVRNLMGWDITDFGCGAFDKFGLFLFTIRNGSPENLKTLTGKVYAEKIMVVQDRQITPMHFHWTKVEDIINRGGGTLAIQLYNSTPEERLADTPVAVVTDGVERRAPAGGMLRLAPGESVTIPTGLYHKFWGEDGKVLVGEVSLVNDDRNDNRFYESVGRFPVIEEDEPPLYLLCSDYARYCRG